MHAATEMPLGLFVNRFVCSGLNGREQGWRRKSEKCCIFWESCFSFAPRPRPSRLHDSVCKLLETIGKEMTGMAAGSRLQAGSKKAGELLLFHGYKQVGALLCQFP